MAAPQANTVTTRVHVVLVAILVLLAAPLLGGWTMLVLACAGITMITAGGIMLQRPLSFVVLMLFWQVFAFLSGPTYFPWVYHRLYGVLRYADEFMFAPLLVVIFGHLVFGRPLKGDKVLVAIMILLGITAASALYHQVSISSTVRYVIAYFRYYIVFVATATLLRPLPATYTRIARVTRWILFIQLAVNACYMAGFQIIPSRFFGHPNDWAVGTMGVSSMVCYWALITFSMALAGLSSRSGLRNRVRDISLLGASFLLLAATNTKHALALAAPQLGIVTFFSSTQRPARKLLFTLLTLGMLMGVAEVYNMAYKEKRQSLYTSRTVSLASQEKVRVYQNVVGKLTHERAWLLGMGPGQYSSVVAMWNTTPLFLEHFYAEIFARRYNPRSSIMLYPRSGVLSLLGDTGLAGLLAYLAILGLIAQRVIRQLAQGAYDASPEARVLAICWLGWACFFVLLNGIADFLNFGLTPLVTFAWAGAIWNPVVKPEEELEAPVEPPVSPAAEPS